MNLFPDGTARYIKTGIIMNTDIDGDLLKSTNTGDGLFKQFIEERIERAGQDHVSFYKSGPKPKISKRRETK